MTLTAFLALIPVQPEARVAVSVQLTLGGAALGGAAWALSLAWADRIGAAAAPPPEPPPRKQSEEEEDLLLYLPLFVVPFP